MKGVKRPRETKFPVLEQFRNTADLAQAITDWMASAGVAERAEAIRRLLERGLK